MASNVEDPKSQEERSEDPLTLELASLTFESASKKPVVEASSLPEQSEKKTDEESDDEDSSCFGGSSEGDVSDDLKGDWDEEYDSDREGKRIIRYWRQLNWSENFFVDRRLFPRNGTGLVIPLNLQNEDCCLAEMAKAGFAFALEEYNKTQDPKLKLVRIIYVNSHAFAFYVTFEGEDTSTGKTSTYQAHYWYLELCRGRVKKGLGFIRPEPAHIKVSDRLNDDNSESYFSWC